MGLVQLTLDTIKDLDLGKAQSAFEIHLQRAVKDCIDRPGDDRARKIVFQLTLKPVKSINGNTIDCESVEGAFQVRSKIPDFETQICDFGVRHNATLVFNPESPRNHRQATIDFDDPGDRMNE